MAEKEQAWMVSGDCTEGCTSPAVCPAYWGSPFPKDMHDGKSQCEGAWSFHINKGHYGSTDLVGLNVCFAFNSPAGFPDVPGPWRCIIYVDSRASDAQAEALEAIYRQCWANMGEVIDVKRGEMSFGKEPLNGGLAAVHTAEIKDVYSFKAEPMLAGPEQKPRYIISGFGGKIYIGKSTVNEFKDTDLPRTWNRPGMSCTYHEFSMNPQRTFWQP